MLNIVEECGMAKFWEDSVIVFNVPLRKYGLTKGVCNEYVIECMIVQFLYSSYHILRIYV